MERGTGQSIFNNTLLLEENFVSEVRDIAQSFNENKNDFHSKMTLWEFLKQNMASAAKKFSVRKSRNDRKMIDEVKQKIEILEAINEEEMTPSSLQTIENLKDVEDKFVSKKIRGSLLRSKLPGVEEGDLNAAYYSKLEILKAEQNTIFSLINKNGELVEGTNKM